jgi:hypothetical protein
MNFGSENTYNRSVAEIQNLRNEILIYKLIASTSWFFNGLVLTVIQN